MQCRVVRFDWAAFQRRVERLRAEHAARTDEQAAAMTLDAFKRWGVAPPQSFVDAHPAAVRCGAPGAVMED